MAHEEERDWRGEKGVEHAGYVVDDAGGGTCEAALTFVVDGAAPSSAVMSVMSLVRKLEMRQIPLIKGIDIYPLGG